MTVFTCWAFLAFVYFLFRVRLRKIPELVSMWFFFRWEKHGTNSSHFMYNWPVQNHEAMRMNFLRVALFQWNPKGTHENVPPVGGSGPISEIWLPRGPADSGRFNSCVRKEQDEEARRLAEDDLRVSGGPNWETTSTVVSLDDLGVLFTPASRLRTPVLTGEQGVQEDNRLYLVPILRKFQQVDLSESTCLAQGSTLHRPICLRIRCFAGAQGCESKQMTA